jgi:hypothetical protein
VRRPSHVWAARFGALGGLVALALLALLQVGSARWGLRSHVIVIEVATVLWPSSFWLMATEGAEGSLFGWTIVAMSIVANMLLYAVFGAIISTFRPSPPTLNASH